MALILDRLTFSLSHFRAFVADEMKLVANGWATELPAGWQDRSMVTMVKPSDGRTFAPNVVVTRQPVTPQTSVEDFARQQRAATLAEIPDLQILDERPTQVAGAPAFQRLQRFASRGQNIQQAQTYVLKDAVVLVITCTATLEQFDAQIADFRRILDSFRFFDADAATS